MTGYYVDGNDGWDENDILLPKYQRILWKLENERAKELEPALGGCKTASLDGGKRIY